MKKLAKCLGPDHDQRVGARVLDRLPHAVEALIERVAHVRVGALGAAGDAGSMAASARKYQGHGS